MNTNVFTPGNRRLSCERRSIRIEAPMNHYTLWQGFAGGVMIGLASLIATAVSGKVPGISGVFGRLLLPGTPDKSWRVVFLLGLIGGAGFCFVLSETAA